MSDVAEQWRRVSQLAGELEQAIEDVSDQGFWDTDFSWEHTKVGACWRYLPWLKKYTAKLAEERQAQPAGGGGRRENRGR